VPELPSYVLITPARNEARFIELTLKSVVAQTVPPLRWVIVSDGSTDGTDEIVERYTARYAWIELVRMPLRKERHFAGKVHAFNAGYARVTGLHFDIVANLDADVSFDEDYLEFLMRKFAENPALGVGGTPFREGSVESSVYDYRFTSPEHVSGQCQLFRRQCFEDIGGYIPRKIGGVDLVAVTSARMKGWQTRSFLDKMYVHHRQMSTANRSGLKVPLYVGRADYVLGSHPIWEFFRCIYQSTKRPFLLNGGLRLAGFVWGVISEDIQVPAEFVRFRRQEQMGRLWKFIIGRRGPAAWSRSRLPDSEDGHGGERTDVACRTFRHDSARNS
jgi:glycosyltransferase involved in cell wall biosynthesis